MGKGDASKTEKMYLVYPSEWKPELEEVRKEVGGLSLPDAVRAIVAQYLQARKEEV